MSVYPPAFVFPYKSVKRAAPTATIYSPITGAAGNLAVVIFSGTSLILVGDAPISNWLINAGSGLEALSYTPVNSGTSIGTSGPPFTYVAIINSNIYYHYTLDSRIGR